MNNIGAPTVDHNSQDRLRITRMVVAGMIILAVMLYMVSQVVNANASARPISALQSSVVPTPRPRPTLPPTLPKTGGEVESPVQDNSGLAAAGIVGLGALLVVGAVVLSRASNNRKSDSA